MTLDELSRDSQVRYLQGRLKDAEQENNAFKQMVGELKKVHSALDAELGDTDHGAHVESDEELLQEYPLQWATEKLAKLIY